MIPNSADAATELCHWQRYLYFRPWYDDAKMVDAGSGEGYGAAFMSHYAASVTGVDISSDAVSHAHVKYSKPMYVCQDVCEFDYSTADFVTCFEVIEHLADPEQLLTALSKCPGRVAISTPNRNIVSPGNGAGDKPFNEYHTIEWTPTEFKEVIEKHFPGRTVRILSQADAWPATVTEGLDEKALFTIAVVGEGELPQWPSLGIAMPTVDNTQQAIESAITITRTYPGPSQIAVVANGTTPEGLEYLRQVEAAHPGMIKVIEQSTNLGYGRGANAGLEWLKSQNRFELFGVTNDDVISAPSTMCELVLTMQGLAAMGHCPGLIAPVTNYISGSQQIEFPEVSNLNELFAAAERRHDAERGNVCEHYQVRGLFFVMTKECLEAVGGFDPRFNMGNFEDDDLNLRVRLAGFTQWIAQGAFLYHHGSRTFNQIFDNQESKYKANIERNMQIFQWKWDLADINDWPHVQEAPEGVELHVPLTAEWAHTFTVNVDGTPLDLVTQVSDIEFVKWVFDRLSVRQRSARAAVVHALIGNGTAVVETEPESAVA